MEKRFNNVADVFCINRNIVECKGNKIVVKLDSCGQVLIETLWNVKIYHLPVQAQWPVVLIETLWNVKISFQR